MKNSTTAPTFHNYAHWIEQLDATSYQYKITNSLGQIIEFYEHPIGGDYYPVVAVCVERKEAILTDFYDTEDFYEGSDYNPVFIDGGMRCEFDI